MTALLRYLLIALGVFVGLVALAWVSLFYTSAGRNFIKARFETSLGSAFGGTTTIGSLEPGLPNLIRITNLSIDEDNDAETTPFIAVQLLEMRWQPFALISGNIDIDTITVSQIKLDHLPLTDNADSTEDRGSIALPDNLPKVNIGAIKVEQFEIGEAVGGKPVTFNAQGRLNMGGRRLVMQLDGLTTDGYDKIHLTSDIDLAAKRFKIDSMITSTVSGLISELAGNAGPVTIKITGKDENNIAFADINAAIGTYGSADFSLRGEMKSGATIAIAGSVLPGVELASLIDYTGKQVDFSVDATPRGNGAELVIKKLSGAIGAATGTINWTDNSDLLASMTTDIAMAFNENSIPEIQQWIGNTLDIKSTVKRQRSRSLFDLNTTLTAPLLTVSIDEGETDLTRILNGHIRGQINAKAAQLAQLDKPITFDAQLTGNSEESIKLDALNFAAGASIKGSGNVLVTLNDETIAADIQTVLTPKALATFYPAATAHENILVKMSVDGGFENFALNSTINVPPLQIDKTLLPANILTASLVGLPAAPHGKITGKPTSGPGGLLLNIQSENEIISITEIDYFSDNFKLTGAAMIAPESNSVAIDLTYFGEADAQPFPNVPVAGDFHATGGFGSQTLSLNANKNPLKIASQRLRFADFLVDNLQATAQGTQRDIAIQLDAKQFTQNDTVLFSDIEIAATINAGDQVTATISKFNALLLSQTQLGLRQAVKITQDETITISDLDLAWGDAGTIKGNAVYGASLWTADFVLDKIIIPSTDGNISLTLALDTSAPIPASGTFSTHLNSDFAQTQGTPLTSTLDGTFLWDGKTLKINDEQRAGSAPLDFDISIPANLQRAESLSVDMSGPLSGQVRYDGPVSTLTAAIPGPAQGLEGLLDMAMSLAGTMSEPVLNGKIEFTDGAFTDENTGLSLIGLHASATAAAGSSESAIEFKGGGRGSNQSGEDRLTLNGRLSVGDESHIDLTIITDGLDIGAGPLTSIRPNGEVKITGPLNDISIAGTIDIDEMNLDIVAQPQTGLVPIEVVAQTKTLNGETNIISINGQSAEDDAVSRLKFDLAITADDQLFVRGLGLESEWKSDLKVATVENESLILGSIQLRRGTFDFSGRRFNVTKGEVIFDRLSKNDPVIALEAQFETSEGLIAKVIASGRSSEPKIELTSTPVRPADDVMSLILFGKPAENLTAIESLQTAQALASLGGIGPFGGGGSVLGGLRQTAGLDLLNIDLDPENGASALTVGKYIADGLFVSATQDIQGKNGSVRIEYEITDNITVESDIRQDGDQTVSANWKRDF